MMADPEALCHEAIKARAFSYAPYSHFSVGAALLSGDGTVYRGCNIENAAYTPTNCAERTAFFKAVSEGCRSFSAIAIAGGPFGSEPVEFCAPCGVCRQVMMEFCDPETFIIYLVRCDAAGSCEIRTYTLSQLLPESFGAADLAR